jgi:dGTP triphosphohydrolase
LRVVDYLESRYGDFAGLNLTFETREGILKHCSARNAAQLGDVGERFVLRRQPGLEAQLANIADELAYNNHDVDDGLRSGLIDIGELSEVSIFRRHLDEVKARHPGIQDRRQVHETIRRMINTLVMDLTRQSLVNIQAAAPASIDEVRLVPALIGFSPPVREEQHELKRFLRTRLYQHYRVARMDRARAVPGIRGGPATAAARVSGKGRHRRRQGDRGLHRGHDRPLRHPGAPSPVRGRADLNPAHRNGAAQWPELRPDRVNGLQY